MRKRRAAIVAVTGCALAFGVLGCGGADPAADSASPAAAGAGTGVQPQAPTPRSSTDFDALYDSGFALPELAQQPVAPLSFAQHSTGVSDAPQDAAHGTYLLQVTDAAQTTAAGTQASGRLRHEYSRRQVFNIDGSRYISQNERGQWFLSNGQSFEIVKLLPELIGDAEPIWHAADPELLLYTARNGGTEWLSLNVNSGKTETVFDFKGKTPWPEATSFSTRGEGTTSANGRYLTLVASSYDDGAQEVTAHGIVTVDLVERRVVGTLDAADFPEPGALPDHVSTSPSGAWAVVSWLAEDGGTEAFSLDFSARRPLAAGSEHSDLAFGPGGEDFFVYADYSAGEITATNIADGSSFALHTLYPSPGAAYAVHISGQAFDRPGWVVISTYGGSVNYGEAVAGPATGAEYDRVWIAELKPDGRELAVAHTRVDTAAVPEDQHYFLEPQASTSRDLSRIIFASNLGGTGINSYLVPLPSWITE